MVVAITVPWLPAGPAACRAIDLGARVAARRARRLRCARPARVDRLRPAAQGRGRRCAAAAGPRREAAAALRSAAGARDSQRPLLAAGRHLHDRRAVQRSRRRTARCRCRCRSAATARRCRPGRCSRKPAQQWQTHAVAAGGCELRRPARTGGARARDRRRSPSRRSPSSMPARARCVPVVLAAAIYAGATLFFHDEQLYPEPQGFWTIGGHAVARDGRGRRRVTRRRSCCACIRARRPTTSTVSTFGWQRTYRRWCPAQAVEVELPMFAERRRAVDDRRRHGVLSAGHRSRRRPTAGSSGIWVEVTNRTAPTP